MKEKLMKVRKVSSTLFVRCRRGRRVKRRSEASLRPTSAVATGNLIYLMSSWLLFHPGPGLQRTQKEHCSFPPLLSLLSSLLLLSFLKA